MTPIYTWDAENGVATCTIMDDKGRKFIGTAKCHPEDLEFVNEYVGCNIALERAVIAYLKSVRRDILEPGLAALNQLYYSMNKSKQFNPKSYETLMLRRQIRLKQDDIEFIKEEVAEREQKLKTYLAEKDMFYKKLLRLRNEQAKSE